MVKWSLQPCQCAATTVASLRFERLSYGHSIFPLNQLCSINTKCAPLLAAAYFTPRFHDCSRLFSGLTCSSIYSAMVARSPRPLILQLNASFPLCVHSSIASLCPHTRIRTALGTSRSSYVPRQGNFTAVSVPGSPLTLQHHPLPFCGVTPAVDTFMSTNKMPPSAVQIRVCLRLPCRPGKRHACAPNCTALPIRRSPW